METEDSLAPRPGALVGCLESGGTGGSRKFNESMRISY